VSTEARSAVEHFLRLAEEHSKIEGKDPRYRKFAADASIMGEVGRKFGTHIERFMNTNATLWMGRKAFNKARQDRP
jgi:hypothetical protein